MIRTVLLSFCCLAMAACSTPAPGDSTANTNGAAASWKLANALVGDWIDSTSSDTFVVHETWRTMNDSTLEGRGHVLAGKDTVFIEALKLERRGEQVIYSALPGGEASGTFTPFTCTHATADTLVFNNQANDFPKRIRYVRDGQGWHATIDEDKASGQREEHFRFLPR